MSYESEMNLAPHETAARLREFANQLESGTLQYGGKAFQVPEQLMMKLELEEQRAGEATSFELEFELYWPVIWKAPRPEHEPADTDDDDYIQIIEDEP